MRAFPTRWNDILPVGLNRSGEENGRCAVSSVLSSVSVSCLCAGTSLQTGAHWINRTFYHHYQYYWYACIPFLWSNSFVTFERGSSIFLWPTQEVFHFLHCNLSAGFAVFLVSGSQTRFSFCVVTLSDILRQSQLTAPGLLLCVAWFRLPTCSQQAVVGPEE